MNRAHLNRTFDLAPGRRIGRSYVVDTCLGSGLEGEVYSVIDQRTGSTRAAKLFFPTQNRGNRAIDFHARKMEQLQDCPLLIRYLHAEELRIDGEEITVLISEYVDGIVLEDFINACPGKRVPELEALSILAALVQGLEPVHARREYHGDLHIGNIMLRRRGIHFDLKLLDLYNHGRPSTTNQHEDILDVVRLLYDMLGGQRWYARQRPEVRWIIGGLKRTLILRRFPGISALRTHLDNFAWTSD